MLKNCVATLNIGSSDIVLTVGERSVNGAFSFRAVEKVNYYSYFDGEFYDVKELEKKIVSLFNQMVERSEISSVSTVYVGVPGEFSKTISKNYKVTFGKVKKITNDDVVYLYEHAFQDDDNEFSLVHRSSVYFILDNYKTHEPVGKNAGSISARISYGLASNYFMNLISGILQKAGVSKIKYVLQDYADTRYLFSLKERDACKLLINVGSTTSSVSIVCGNGLLYSSAFALGGGMISAYLSEGLNCDYFVADALKSKLNLGLIDKKGAKYTVSDTSGDYEFDRSECNEIAKKVLDEIAEACDKAVSGCTLKVPSDIEIAFTGEGICAVKGAVEYVSMRLGVFPKVAQPKVPHYNKPKYTSRLALIDTALSLAKDKIFFTV